MKAFVWRESVYKTRKCPECGTELIGADNRPKNVKMIMLSKDWLLCEKCGRMVAIVKEVEDDGEYHNGEMMGKWQGEL